MKIALVTDELHPINTFALEWLQKRKIDFIPFGAYTLKNQRSWVEMIQEAADAVANGLCDEGIFFCWSGTGASIISNKNKGLRAALCTDPETAKLAREWNHANVLVLSNRSLSPHVAEEVLNTWFAPYDKQIGANDVEILKTLD